MSTDEPGSNVDAIIDQLSVFDWANGAANENMPDGGTTLTSYAKDLTILFR